MKNKIDRLKIPIDLENDKIVLVRENDGKIIKGSKIIFIEWNEDGTFKSSHDEPKVGRGILVDPPFGWLTTQITEILPNNVFKTKNSTYIIHQL